MYFVTKECLSKSVYLAYNLTFEETALTMSVAGKFVLFLVSLVCCASRGLRRADQASREVLPNFMCLTVCDCAASIIRWLWPTRGCCALGEKIAVSAEFYGMNYSFKNLAENS
jgi:hypothetical protein